MILPLLLARFLRHRRRSQASPPPPWQLRNAVQYRKFLRSRFADGTPRSSCPTTVDCALAVGRDHWARRCKNYRVRTSSFVYTVCRLRGRRGHVPALQVAAGIKKNLPFRAGSLCWRYLSSRAVARKVLSAQVSLTSVFGMGTGGPSPQSTPTSSIQASYPSLRRKRQSSIIPLYLLSEQNPLRWVFVRFIKIYPEN